ncbi:MAG TPA: RNA polymerase sporulation sigma factor SigG [Clostridia bacterium]|nr:MAG: RNA polymerase sigma-F factor [Firmicutes bacterium ADurb.Bin248]HOG02212.1 RNA polymerase sporulation sigma factor SigG [Clostridia bacterium]HOS19084.1 RNA polymerase sporulation sigma factor SigG [Clostridia bacterium]HPK15396.1 RNA polymerase sporulation sigma factor SigG [Clostridia bacterium]
MALNKVDICGLDTSSLPRLTQQQSRDYLLKIKAGDTEAREEFIRANLRLVLSVIQRFSGRGEQMDDLFQVGCIGLIKAVENFNTDLDVRFSTYAVPMIIGELRRYLRDNTTLRVSRSLRDTAYKALRVRNDLMDRLSREPRLDEIARELEMSEEDVAFALEAIQDPVSLFEPIYHDDGDAIFVMDQVRDDRDCDDCWLDGIAIGSGLDRLAERERKIIELRFFQGRTQMEVAEEIGISQAQVSRLEKSALKHMRKYV